MTYTPEHLEEMSDHEINIAVAKKQEMNKNQFPLFKFSIFRGYYVNRETTISWKKGQLKHIKNVTNRFYNKPILNIFKHNLKITQEAIENNVPVSFHEAFDATLGLFERLFGAVGVLLVSVAIVLPIQVAVYILCLPRAFLSARLQNKLIKKWVKPVEGE